VLGRSWPTERPDALEFSAAPGLPGRVQQVLERLSFYGLVGNAPDTEAGHNRAVRAPQRRCVWVIGKVKAVAFGQLRSSVCFSHAALNVTRKLPDQPLIHPSTWKVDSANFALQAISEGRSLFAQVSENDRYLERRRSHPYNLIGCWYKCRPSRASVCSAGGTNQS
jgi:hypothetical protein